METKILKVTGVLPFGAWIGEGADRGLLHYQEWPENFVPKTGDEIPVFVKSISARGAIDYGTTLPAQWPEGLRVQRTISQTFVGKTPSAPDVTEEHQEEWVFRSPVWKQVLPDGREVGELTRRPKCRHENIDDWDRGRCAKYLYR